MNFKFNFDSDAKQIAIGALAALGTLSLLSKFKDGLCQFYRIFLRRTSNVAMKYGNGSWVFITGGSNGLGLAFANLFASKGFNLIISGRNQENLSAARQKLEQAHNVKVISIVLDLDVFSDGDLNAIEETILGLDVSVYVNCAGKFSIGCFHNYSHKILSSFINTNVSATMKISHLFVKRFRERNLKSAIIYITTFDTGSDPVPFTSIYSGTKNFIDFFGRALHQEYKDKIDILVMRPFVFESRFTNKNDYNYHWTTITPEQVAYSGLKNLGYTDVVYGEFKHTFASLMIGRIWKQLVDFKKVKEGFLIQRS